MGSPAFDFFLKIAPRALAPVSGCEPPRSYGVTNRFRSTQMVSLPRLCVVPKIQVRKLLQAFRQQTRLGEHGGLWVSAQARVMPAAP